MLTLVLWIMMLYGFEFLQGEYLVVQGCAPHVTLLTFLWAFI